MVYFVNDKGQKQQAQKKEPFRPQPEMPPPRQPHVENYDSPKKSSWLWILLIILSVIIIIAAIRWWCISKKRSDAVAGPSEGNFGFNFY